MEGLLEYEKARGPSAVVTQARARGEAYLLERRMLRSLSSGEVIERRWTRFSFPVVWYYDVLRGLDYLRNAGVKPDQRVAEAIAVVEERQHQNGRWPLDHLHRDSSRVPIQLETEGRQRQPLEHAARPARARTHSRGALSPRPSFC